MSELADFCARLSRLRAESGDPTLVWLSGRPLCPSKSQLSKIFRGQVTTLPDADVVRGIVAACAHWARRRGHATTMPSDERHWLIERDIVERRIGEARPARPAGCTLPRDLATFTGREADVAALLAAVERTGRAAGIHAVHGMPGVGKTALAVHVAHRLAGRFPDGQFFVDLRGYTRDQTPVPATEAVELLLLAAGVDARAIPRDAEARAAMWRDRMTDRAALLLLDNARSAAQVRPLLPNSLRCLVLVTSRQRLAELQDTHAFTLDVLDPPQAVEMFRRLARPREWDAAAAAEIVRSCGYLPLAITLLAGRFRHRPTWTLRHLADRIAASGAGAALAEFRAGDEAVAKAFELSYRDLHAAEQQLFRRLALHPGTEFDSYAAASLDDAQVRETGERLESLYDDHLLLEVAPGRYRFHDLIRQYAAELAERDPATERAAAQQRLLVHYLQAAARASAGLPRYYAVSLPVPGDPAAGMPALRTAAERATWWETELENLVACCALAAVAYPVYAAHTVLAVDGFLRLHGRHHRALALLHDAQRCAGLPEDHLAHLQRRIGVGWYLLGECDRALDALGSARSRFAAAGDPVGEADALDGISVVETMLGKHEQALGTARLAHRMFRAAGSELGLANTAQRAGSLLRVSGRITEAIECYEEALRLHDQLGNRHGRAVTLDNLGQLNQQLGRFDYAERIGREAYELHVGIGGRIGQANALGSLALICLRTGRYAEADRLSAQAEWIFRSIDHQHGIALTLEIRAVYCRVVGHYAEAVRLHEEQLRIFGETGGEVAFATSAVEFGFSLCRAGDPGRARELLLRAIELLRAEGVRSVLADALAALGTCHTLLGEHVAAAAALGESLRMTAEFHGRGETQAHNGLGELAVRRGDAAAAARHHQLALERATAAGMLPERARALAGLGRAALLGQDREAAHTHLCAAAELYAELGGPEAGELRAVLLGS